MRKWPLLIPNAIAATCLPFICLSSCGKEEKKEILPDQIEVWYGDHQTGPIELDVNSTLKFFATTFPEEATKNLVFNSSNESLAKFEGNKLVPQSYDPFGFGTTTISAYPKGHPEFISRSTSITVTIVKEIHYDIVDESQVEVVKPIITRSEDNTYGITLSNFKTDWAIATGFALDHLTAQIQWLSVESMEDDAAGIINIKHDSFYNSTFDVICSFTTTETIALGHEFKFKLNYSVPAKGINIPGTKDYSVLYEGDDNLNIDDTSVAKEVDFNCGDRKHATITGFQTNFDFGDGTPYKLEVTSYDFVDVEKYVPQYEIINKRKEGDCWTFDVSIILQSPIEDFDERMVHFYFKLNNVNIYSSEFKLNPVDMIKWDEDSDYFEVKKDGDVLKMTLPGFETNFDFSTTSINPLTVNFRTSDEIAKPKSYSIIKTGDRTFDLEFIWEEDLTNFDLKPFILDFYLGSDTFICFFSSTFKYAMDNITFDGDTNLKFDYNAAQGKYFIEIHTFQSNFGLDRDLLSIDNLSFDSPIEVPEIGIKLRSVYSEFIVYLYWNEPVECSTGINGSFDVVYDGKIMIDDFSFTFIEPSADYYYDITTESNYGDVDVIYNKKDEIIKIGIKNVDLISREFTGFYIKEDDSYETHHFASYEYISQPQDDYKIMIYIDPNSELAWEPLKASDKIIVGATFEDKSHVINLTESKQSSLMGYDMPSFQTKNAVNLTAGSTYYIKADLSMWDESAKWTSPTMYPLGFFFFCGKDLDDDRTYERINTPFHFFYQKYGINSIDDSSYGANTIVLETDEFALIQSPASSLLTFVWTPSKDISNVYFALNASGSY